jgi:hypothetical protein
VVRSEIKEVEPERPVPVEPTPRRTPPRRLLAFAFYLGLTLLLFGPRILTHMSDRVLTVHPGDWGLFVWSFQWWPHAMAHGLDPLFTRVLWTPMGLNLAWATVVPVPSFALLPVTRFFGSVTAFNVVSLLAPATAAWTGYLLCSHFTRRAFAPSLAGGFVFGFSPYLMSQVITGHVNLSLVLMLPVCTLLVVGLLEGWLKPRRFVVLMTAALVIEFGISTEVFATMALFGGIAAGVAWFVAPASWRRPILEALGWVGLSYVLAAVVVSPYILATVVYPGPFKPIFAHPVAPIRGGDLVRLLVPGRTELFGLNFGVPRTPEWNYHLERYAWYVPFPLIAIAVHLWIRKRAIPMVKIALLLFVIMLVLSLGPAIVIAGHRIVLPWSLVQAFPLIKRAFPYRMTMFAFLALSVCVAYWLAAEPRSVKRWSVFALAGVLLLPNVVTDVWTTDINEPAFFSSGMYRSYITPSESVWIVDADGGRSMLWQVTTGWYFRLAGGYTGVVPPDLKEPLTEWRLITGDIRPGDDETIREFVSTHGVGAVVVGEEPDQVVRVIAGALGATPTEVGGITFIDVPAPA